MIGIRCSRTALHYKRLSSVMNRVADSNSDKKGSKQARASSFFFSFFFFFWGGGVHFNGSVTQPTYCTVTVKECMAE